MSAAMHLRDVKNKASRKARAADRVCNAYRRLGYGAAVEAMKTLRPGEVRWVKGL